jgi:hypothetical protein
VSEDYQPHPETSGNDLEKSECSILNETVTPKRVQLFKPAAEGCEEGRRAFAFEVGKYPPNYLVTADESAVDLLTTYRLNGWAYKGTRARKACNFVRGPRYEHP